MTTVRFFTVIVACWMASIAGVAGAQQQTTTRGTAKVQPRFFNPFDVSRSRLTMNRFGMFSLHSQAAGRTAQYPFATDIVSSPPVVTLLPASAPAVSGAPAASSVESSAEEEPAAEASMSGGGSAVRPPYRPPVRSPFRPPPRPPFIP